jgi:hypothetical protein
VGRPENGGVVPVADGEGVGQGVVVRDVRTGVIAHGQGPVLGSVELGRRVGGDEPTHGAAIPTQVLGLPIVGEVVSALASASGDIEVVREQLSDGGAGGVAAEGLGECPEAACRVVVESADPLVGAEVVIEGPVLLHQEHHVLDGTEVRAGRWCAGRPRHGGGRAARRQHRGAAGQHRSAQESPTAEPTAECARSSLVPHGAPSSVQPQNRTAPPGPQIDERRSMSAEPAGDEGPSPEDTEAVDTHRLESFTNRVRPSGPTGPTGSGRVTDPPR